jgi:peroxiredoxin
LLRIITTFLVAFFMAMGLKGVAQLHLSNPFSFFNKSGMRKFFGLLFLLVNGVVGLHAADNGELIKTGIWQGVLQRPDGANIIFNFDAQLENGKQVLYVINADDRLLVDDITKKGDSLWINMPFFGSSFAVRVKADGNWEGLYAKSYGSSRRLEIPFIAKFGVSERFPLSKTKFNLTGRWAVKFGDSGVVTPAIGEFEQQPNGKITGTFLTTTGDYRYLEGSVNGNNLTLSGFDGGYAILFTAKIKNNNQLYDAYMYSSLSAPNKWTAVKNANAELPDGYGVSKLRDGESKLNFKFAATTGDSVSINDAQYAGKVVVIQILGSWCPNCLDETEFLVKNYKENKQKGVEVIGLAYERTTDFEQSVKALAPFQKRLNVPYPFLVTGVAVSDPKRVEKTLPQLDKIEAFPTTIFIDKKGLVRKIHSGYDGPATGKHYEVFKKEFDEVINSLLKEQ